ncbi:E3 SUMO-protein ligase ZBED1-like [Montipora capricornis]|uniref:E3 SUMO-protein ligase ZBED1-like n=1 Tax=Montipora capricornis TaxID=246305 RepID=UPI0035F1B721
MACEQSFEIVPNKKVKSSVWNHFGFLKENDGPVDKYSGNTTNLTDHLRRKHSKFLKEQSESTSSDAKAATVMQTTHSSQQVLSTMFSAKLPHSSSRAKAISGAILQFIVKDLRPFSVVENSGFQNLLHVLEPRYTIPSRQHFSDKALPELYEAEAVAVALTTDGWTSRATESYVTITCNYINKEWKLRSDVLQTRCLPESHTGVNIANVLREAVHEWNLPPNPPVVSENASNMTVAAEELGTPLHVGC